MNRLVRGTVGMALLGIDYQEADKRRHLDISECPRNEQIKRERGRGEFQTTEKWRQSDPGATFYYIRRMGDMAM